MRLDGYTIGAIADALDVGTTSVKNWKKLYDEGGWTNLKPLKRGRAKDSGKRLNPKQEKKIQKLIRDKNPEQLKLDFALWTRPAIRDLVSREFGVDLPVRTLGDYLKRWGFTPQRPLKKSYEQQPERVRQWLDVEYPAIAKRSKRENAEILWSDETGLSNQDHRGRGYAPKGQTPTVTSEVKRVTTSMISAVSNKGSLRFMVYKGSLKTDTFIEFLKRLVKSAEKKWVEKSGKIELFFIPPYSPELNPDEYLNQTLKAQIRNKPAAKDGKSLQQRVRKQMRSNQKRPALVKSLFRHKHVKYAA